MDKYFPFFHNYGEINLSSIRLKARDVLTEDEFEFASQLEDKLKFYCSINLNI
jgi:hypothetical protein